MAINTLRKLLKQSDSCVLAPCVYDCVSVRAVELVGFKVMMRLWIQFAKTGNPSIDGFMEWPAWEQITDNYLYINDPLQVKTGFSKVVS